MQLGRGIILGPIPSRPGPPPTDTKPRNAIQSLLGNSADMDLSFQLLQYATISLFARVLRRSKEEFAMVAMCLYCTHFLKHFMFGIFSHQAVQAQAN